MTDIRTMKQRKVPKKLSLVRFDAPWLSPQQRRAVPFTKSGVYLFLGEVANMPEHCVVMDYKANRTYVGYHTDNFIQLADDET